MPRLKFGTTVNNTPSTIVYQGQVLQLHTQTAPGKTVNADYHGQPLQNLSPRVNQDYDVTKNS